MSGNSDNGQNWSKVIGLFRQNKSGNSPHPRNQNLIYAIGDIHGRHDLMIALLEKVRLDMISIRSRLRTKIPTFIVFLGDYIDRGHESKQVIETLCNIKFDHTELIFLKGNHEEAALKFLDMEQSDTAWLSYGGRETLASYGISCPSEGLDEISLINVKATFKEFLPSHHLAFLEQLQSYWISGQYMFVHAGIDPKKPPEEQSDKEYLWIRDGFLSSIRKLPYIIVHGHTPEDSPTWDGRRIGIDTGAYISNRLTAVKLVHDSIDFLST